MWWLALRKRRTRAKKEENEGFFSSTSFKKDLDELFQDPDFLEGLAYRKTRKSEKGVLQDIQDGSEYQRILKTRFLDHPYNFTIGFNTDGVSPYKSSNMELWPIFWMVHNLSKNMRFRVKYTRLYGLYYGKKKKTQYEHVFSPFSHGDDRIS